VNTIPSSLVNFSDYFSIAAFTGELLYAGVVTMVGVFLQAFLALQAEDTASQFVKALLVFLKTAFNFVVAWAWQGALNLAYSGEGNFCDEQILGQLIWCTVLLAAGATLAFTLANANSDDPSQLAKDVRNLLVLVVGINIGWAFSDFAAVCYSCTPGLAGPLGSWLFACLVATGVGGLAWLATRIGENLKRRAVAEFVASGRGSGLSGSLRDFQPGHGVQLEMQQ